MSESEPVTENTIITAKNWKGDFIFKRFAMFFIFIIIIFAMLLIFYLKKSYDHKLFAKQQKFVKSYGVLTT